MVRTRSGEHSTGSVSMPVSGVAQRPPRPPINRGKAPTRQETYGEGPSAPRVVPARQEMYQQLAADELEHFRRYMVAREFLAERDVEVKTSLQKLLPLIWIIENQELEKQWQRHQ
ncbi:hypothetical protein Dimus_015885 [Dionaea muscipula]